MSHQDWNTVVLRNPKLTGQNAPKETVKRPVHSFQKEADAETNPIKTVSNDLKRKIIATRLAYMEPGSSKAGITQERMAVLAKVKASDVKLLEQGKLDMKQAKQIALSIERSLKVKIL